MPWAFWAPAFAAAPGSLKRCSRFARSRSRSKRARKGRPSMPSSRTPRAFSAIVACMKLVTAHSFKVPISFPLSKRTFSRSTLLPIFWPIARQASGVSVASAGRAVASRKMSGLGQVPTRMRTTSKPLPSTPSGAGSVRSSCASTSSAPASTCIPLWLAIRPDTSSRPCRQAWFFGAIFRPFSYAARASCCWPDLERQKPYWA
mmetsp:Transcript_59196/g.152295  ORF Transcript_59196/g.152295 Transcript_59196/m.152295 type:complete len:203 (+) Transcript_59196:652-1260(+)